jgi:hypothetical protein
MLELITESVDNIASPTQRFEVLMTMGNKECCVLEHIAM